MRLTVDLAGWIGAAILLIAYALVSFDKLRAESFRYQIPNAVGSFLLIVNTVYNHAYPSAVLNVVWVVIAFLASVRAKNRQSRAAGS